MATKPKSNKVKRSEQEFVDANGNEVDTADEATGLEYTLVGSADSLVYQYGQNPNHDRMYAVFGFGTLATNEASQVRQNDKKASASDQMAAVRERHDLIGTGVWVDRKREGVTRLFDKAILASIIAESAAARGKTVDEAKILAKLESNAAWYADCQRNPEYIAAYRERQGKPAKSVDDLLGEFESEPAPAPTEPTPPAA